MSKEERWEMIQIYLFSPPGFWELNRTTLFPFFLLPLSADMRKILNLFLWSSPGNVWQICSLTWFPSPGCPTPLLVLIFPPKTPDLKVRSTPSQSNSAHNSPHHGMELRTGHHEQLWMGEKWDRLFPQQLIWNLVGSVRIGFLSFI